MATNILAVNNDEGYQLVMKQEWLVDLVASNISRE